MNYRPALVSGLLAATPLWCQSPDPLFSADPQRSAFNVTLRSSASVSLVDLDADGLPDAVFAGPEVQWGTGAGFEPGADLFGYPNGNGFVSAPVVFDCDGDGDLDLLQPASTGVPRSLWLNRGGRRFDDATATNLAIPFQFDTIRAAADIDGDGDLDVLGDMGGVWINDGLGAFRDESATRTPGLPALGAADRFLLVVFDADGDGDLDALIRAGLLRNDGAGVFAFDGSVPHNQGGPLSVVPFDADGDGDLDLISSNGALLRNDGGGVFARESFADGVRDVGDVDGDGRVDLLLIPNRSPAAPSWAPGTAAGFGAPRALPFAGTETEVDPNRWRVQLVDAEGDGDLDVVASLLSATQDPPPLLLANDGRGSFEPAYELNAGEVDAAQRHLVFDVNGDGSLDLVTSTDVYLNDGGGRFVQLNSMPNPRGRPLCFGDWDADGDVDVLVDRGTSIAVFDNDGSGAFAVRVGATNISGTAFEAVDWEGDGDQDLLALTPNAVVLWRNEPGGLLESRLEGFTVSSTIDMAVGDFDSDGRPDVAVALASPASTQWTDIGMLLQDAAGNLRLGPYATLGRVYRRLEVGDLDGDGRDDLLATGAAVTAAFRQLPTGIYERRFWSVPQGDVRFADLDGDGDVDVLRRGVGLELFRNDGPAGFPRIPSRQPPTCCQFLWDLTVADLDGDADLDVIYGARTSQGPPAQNGVYVHWNVTRHLRLSGLIAVGGFLDVEVRSALGRSDPSRIALTTIGFGRGRLAVPGLGTILIDTNGAVSMPWAPFGGGDTSRSRVSIPLVPSLVGVELFVQSATLGTSTPPELTHVATGRVHG